MVIDMVTSSWMRPPAPRVTVHTRDDTHTGVKPVLPWRSRLPTRWNPGTARLFCNQGEESLTGSVCLTVSRQTPTRAQ